MGDGGQPKLAWWFLNDQKKSEPYVEVQSLIDGLMRDGIRTRSSYLLSGEWLTRATLTPNTFSGPRTSTAWAWNTLTRSPLNGTGEP